MGPASDPTLVMAAARAADAVPAVSDVWVVDHVAIPPDDAEGSGGRYLDPLATLAFLAGLSRVATGLMLVGLVAAVVLLGWRAGKPGTYPAMSARTPVRRTTP